MATEAGTKIHDTLNAPNDAAAKAAISPHVPPPKQGMADPRYGVEQCCVREFWAVIERDATLVRGRNVLRTRKLGTGIYEVFFTGDVSNGAFVATIGRPGIATEPPGEITVALRCCPGLGLFEPFEGDKGVWIQTFDSAGKPSDRSFHLIVLTH
ncbi:hypothetical protein KIP88_12845 [Bradyrhizobium sp. SRL28]|uniref:hypothetical protein n=1 Tax=Bradyrhizobium sp. SRL28 TaxID=2836178 RepID=UPI001BDEFBE7|nr:hypothetical protein [Bradyrhizobium sp. SRL28]MBT1511394.1 hypothetical protein [Bradyrhizobium sp. SRL28]